MFEGLHSQGQQTEVRDWVLLSLGSFIQRYGVSLANTNVGKFDLVSLRTFKQINFSCRDSVLTTFWRHPCADARHHGIWLLDTDIYTFSVSLPPHPSDSKCKFASTAWSASKRDPGKGWCKPPSHLTCGVFTTFLTPKFLERQDCMLLRNSTYSIFIRFAIFLWLFEPQSKNFLCICEWKLWSCIKFPLSPVPSPKLGLLV